MDKKIKGWVDDRAANGPATSIEWTKLFVRKLPIPCLPAVLFIGTDGKPPKVWTEQEVKVMLSEMLANTFSAHQVDSTMRRDDVEGVSTYAIESIAAKHGIQLP